MSDTRPTGANDTTAVVDATTDASAISSLNTSTAAAAAANVAADDNLQIHTNVQRAGYLHKTPLGHVSTRWSRRFFVLKDGFLLWYSEKDGKVFENTGVFNVHPKAAVPLGGCFVEEFAVRGMENTLRICHPDFGEGQLLLAADTHESLKSWMTSIRDSGRVTWRNAQIGKTMIAC